MAPRRSARVVKVQSVVNYENLTVNEVLCPICRSILIEPVTLPCNHGFCSSCFQGTMENANLVCPLCRTRIASWLRSSRKENKLINIDYWNAIQKNFPTQIKNKLEGIEEDLDYETPLICLAGHGELKQEFEKQIKQETDTLRKEREAEVRASEELIRKIKEEEEYQRKLDAEKLKLDEEIAKKLADELNSPHSSKVKKNGKHGTIDKYFKNNTQKNEFTCKILYQEPKTDKGTKPIVEENISSKKIDEVRKRIVEAGNNSDSSDSIDQECRFFKPIDSKCNVPCFTSSPLKIPVIRPKKTQFQFKPPNGKNTLRSSETNDNKIISAFTKFIPIVIQNNNNTESKLKKESKSPEKKISSPVKKQNGRIKSPKKTTEQRKNNSPTKRKHETDEERMTKKMKSESNNDRLLNTPSSPFRGFPSSKLAQKNEDESKKDEKLKEQEKLDFELAKRLHEQINRMSYSTRSATVPKSKNIRGSKQTTLDKLLVKKTYKV